MKSHKTTVQQTQVSTPHHTLVTESDEPSLLSIPTFRHTNSKMYQFMTDTLKSHRQFSSLTRSTIIGKQSKARISIIPLTREKIRVGQRGWKRSERGTADAVLSGRGSPLSKCQSGMDVTSLKFKEFFTMLSFMYNKTKRGSYKLQIFIEEACIYFSKRKESQYIKSIEQIIQFAVPLRQSLIQGSTPFTAQILKSCEYELSKLFFCICYEIYLYKKKEFSLLQLSIIHRDIEYYTRRLGMLTLTLGTCLDMGRIFLDYFDYYKAEEEFTKSVKLAVFIGDKYREELAIDRLGMCEYYRGDMMSANFYHSSVNKLSNYNKVRIKEYYSNQHEIQKILDEKTKEKSHQDVVKEEFFRLNKENIQFNFDSMAKDTQFCQKNYNCFKSSLKEMIKVNSLRKKMPIIKTALDKTHKIGQKAYRGKDYLLPKASKFYQRSGDRSQDQFIQSHKSFNRNNVAYQSTKIDKHCKIIDQILNFFQNDSKTAAKVIKEQRQSLMSQQS